MARRRFTRRARLAALRNLRKARRALRRRSHRTRRARVTRRRFTRRARIAALRNLRKARAARRGTRRVHHGRAYRLRLARLRNLRKARAARRSGRTKRAYAAVDSRWESAMAPGGDFFGMAANPKRVNRKTKRGKNVAQRRRMAAILKRRRRLKGRVVIFPGGRIAVFHKPGTAAFRAGRAKKKAMGRRLARLYGFKKSRRGKRKVHARRRRNPSWMWR